MGPDKSKIEVLDQHYVIVELDILADRVDPKITVDYTRGNTDIYMYMERGPNRHHFLSSQQKLQQTLSPQSSHPSPSPPAVIHRPEATEASRPQYKATISLVNVLSA